MTELWVFQFYILVGLVLQYNLWINYPQLIQGCLLLLTGDQGFLNSYYSEFANAHVFDPDLSPVVRKSMPAPEMERLSTLYNADVGLYMLANKVIVCARISCCTCYVIKICDSTITMT